VILQAGRNRTIFVRAVHSHRRGRNRTRPVHRGRRALLPRDRTMEDARGAGRCGAWGAVTTTQLADATVDAYLERIGAARPARPTVEALFELQERHVMTVPYETLDFHLRRPQPIGAPAIEKIVGRRRGGTCYELNGSLSALLAALGFEVDVLGARVNDGGEWGAVLGHMLLRVVAADSPERWLVDVGYGRGPRLPLRFGERGPQQDPHGVFQVRPAPLGDLDVLRDGKLQYRVETRPRTVGDFEHVWWWYRNDLTSPMNANLYCTLPTAGGRVTLSGDTLTLRENGSRTTVVFDGD